MAAEPLSVATAGLPLFRGALRQTGARDGPCCDGEAEKCRSDDRAVPAALGMSHMVSSLVLK
jgi:hypothetical protein